MELVVSRGGVYENLTRYAMQGMIYNRLRGTSFEYLHDTKRFKFFTFSEVFPIGDLREGDRRYFIVSSPWEEFINILHDSFEDDRVVRIGDIEFEVGYVKRFRIGFRRIFESGSPIVLYKDNRKNEYFSFMRGGDIAFFIWRLTDNAVKKYNAYYSEQICLREPIFDRLVFKKEVAVQECKNGRRFIIIGSVWKILEKKYVSDEYRKLYEFIADCGVGEKNSLGFGFINPVKMR